MPHKMETKIYNQEGKASGSVELNESIFAVVVNENLVHRALVYQLANARIAVAHTKTRWERRGSTRKIYRQKWTGRARMGSNRSPIRKKGWVAFGPRNNRNFTISMNRKERRAALFSVLTSKFQDNNLIVVDGISFDVPSTKKADAFYKALPYEKNILFWLVDSNSMIEKSSANLPYVKTILSSYLNIKDLLKYNTLVLEKDSLEKLNALVA